jgi:putative heme iron utilization protein
MGLSVKFEKKEKKKSDPRGSFTVPSSQKEHMLEAGNLTLTVEQSSGTA